ncbi:MAG: PTS sugar transporter subunit IIB [Lachnospiraceae bacterium]|nr:PTS sugar transporter subunit IIB [Lachnospiraceae bacterium]MDD7048766.1 PTS sugar transporter subunit IIB [Lachnospiraceae bacterium]
MELSVSSSLSVNYSAFRSQDNQYAFENCFSIDQKRNLFSTPDSERFAFLGVSGQSGFAACPPLRKFLKPFGEQALRPDFISFLGVLNNYQKRKKELDMLNVLCVCGNGMGTSTILKINVKKICDANKIDAIVDSCAFSEAMTYLFNTDIVLTSPEWAEMLPPSNAHIVKMKNLVDMQEISDKLLAEVKENFPEEWNG